MISSASIKMVMSEIQWFLKEYYFEEFIKLLYYFTWSKVCAWYLKLIKFVLCRDNEEEKTVLTQNILLILFRNLLRMIYFFIPFKKLLNRYDITFP